MERLQRLITPRRWEEKKAREERWRKKELIEEKATEYLETLRPLPSPPPDIQVLNEELGTTIQVFEAENPTKFVVLIPGYDSSGQSRKYDCLIAELLLSGVSVARINNQPKIKEPDNFVTEDYYATRRRLFIDYMFSHLGDVNNFLTEHGYLPDIVDLHVIASSAGAAAALVTFQLFDKLPKSLVLLSPSGDIHPSDSVMGAAIYIFKGGRIHAVRGEIDSFGRQQPFVSLEKLAETLPTVTISQIENAGHDMRENYPWDAENTVQVRLHRECLFGLGLPVDKMEEFLNQ